MVKRTSNQIAETVSDSQLLEELQERNEELKVLFSISSTLAAEGSFSQKAKRVVEGLAEIAQAELAVIYMANNRDQCHDLVASTGPRHAEYPLLSPLPYGQGVVGQAFQTGEPVVANDYVAFPGALPEYVAVGEKSALALPIRFANSPSGVFVLGSGEKDHFTPDLIKLLGAVASQLGPLIENTKLQQEMAVVDEVARIITSTLDIDRVYEQFSVEVNKLVDSDWAGISVFDAIQASFTTPYSWPQDSSYFGPGQTFPLEGSFNSANLKTGRTLIWEDATDQESEFWSVPILLREGRRSMISVPLNSRGKVLGAFALVSNLPRAYGVRERRIVERLASQIAPAIHNSLLFREVQQQALALESIGDGVIFLDLDANIQFVNWAFLETFGYRPDEVLGKPVSLLIPSDGVSQDLFKETVGAKAGWRGEAERVKKNGERFDVLLTVTPVLANDGTVIGRIGVIRDITESKRAEKRLRETARLSSIGELAAGVAHEINNPLTSVLGFSQLLMSEDLPQAVRNDVEIVHSEASRAAKIVHNLLSFARTPEPTKIYMDVTSMLEKALGVKFYDFRVSNIRVSRDFPPDLPFTMIDEQQLIQVTLNILNNAEQAMGQRRGRGHLIVRTADMGESIRISFSDDGAGIPAQHLGRIFEPFFTSKAVGEGTGLGLSISYGIVHQHGGHIWADTTLGEGTTVHVELPITGHPDHDASRHDGPLQPLAQYKRVLVVDDEPNIRELLVRSLQSERLSVDLAEDGEVAWQRVQERSYHCIILDLKMPGMSGQQLYRAIDALDREQARKVIFLTGDMVNPDTFDFVTGSGNPAFSKPVSLDELHRQVRITLELTREPIEEPTGRSV